MPLTAVETEFVEYVRGVVDAKIAPLAESFDQSGEFPWSNVKLLNELGMNGVFIPEEYGGSPLSYRAYLQLVEVLSRACPATAITWATTFHAIAPVVTYGTDEQKAQYLPRIAAGGLAAVAITEQSGGSDATAMRSSLVPDGSDLILNGSKIFITNGDVADVILTFAKWPGGAGAREQMTCVLVDRDTPGFEVVSRESKLGHRASSTNELRFDDCRLNASNVLGELGSGFQILLSMLNRSRPSVAAQAIGIGLAAFAETQRYVNERQQFGQRILDFQAVQFMLADMATSLVMAKCWLQHVGRLVDENSTDFDVEASILKLVASDAAMNIATQAVQLQGGHGYMTGAKVERLFRDAKLTQIWEGANEVHRTRVGKSFLDRTPGVRK
jgi:alkylation response protein AidB-like acyl-CoA dehydrogenase